MKQRNPWNRGSASGDGYPTPRHGSHLLTKPLVPYRLRNAFVVIAVALGMAVSFAAWGSSSTSSAAAAGTSFKVCYAVGLGGINDNGYYQLGYQGLKAAQAATGIKISYITAQSAADYVPILETFVHGSCNLILVVGSPQAPSVESVAKANPKQKFILVDTAFFDSKGKPVVIPNVINLVFRDEQSSFVAGFIAAGYSKTGIVSIWGGQLIGPVIVHQYGFADGVAYYNKLNHAHVKLLGWNSSTGTGAAVGDFTNTQAALALTQQQISAGSDVIFAVGGSNNTGAVTAARQHPGTALVWPDIDTCKQAAEASACPVQLTATLKHYDVAIDKIIKQLVVNQKFTGGVVIRGLSSGAVAVAPPHKVPWPAKVTAELPKVEAAIDSGKITPRGCCGA